MKPTPPKKRPAKPKRPSLAKQVERLTAWAEGMGYNPKNFGGRKR